MSTNMLSNTGRLDSDSPPLMEQTSTEKKKETQVSRQCVSVIWVTTVSMQKILHV